MAAVDLSRFRDSHARLAQAYARYQAEQRAGALDDDLLMMLRDSVTQRYEFTTEQAWKTLQRLLAQDDDSKTVEEARKGSRSALRLAFEKGWITDFKLWLAMVDLRNDGSHNYDENIHAAILSMTERALPAMKETLATIEALQAHEH